MEIKSILVIVAALVFFGLFIWISSEKKEVAVFKKLRLLPRWVKVLGLVVFVSSAILPFEFDTLIDGSNYIGLNFANIGLFLICFSKDKLEDEMTNMIRLKSLYRSVILGFVYATVFYAIDFIYENEVKGTSAIQLVFIILFFYLINYNVTKLKIRRGK